MKGLTKSGEFSTGQVLGFILGVAGVALIITVMITVIAPVFNKEEATTESYLRLLTDSVAEADDGYGADFSMWQPLDEDDKKEDRDYYLVYFGNRAVHSSYGKKFFVSGIFDNYICICSSRGNDVECSSCVELDLPAKKKGESSEVWVVLVDDSARITKGEEYYEFDVTSRVRIADDSYVSPDVVGVPNFNR
jgi:hypothetical protein